MFRDGSFSEALFKDQYVLEEFEVMKNYMFVTTRLVSEQASFAIVFRYLCVLPLLRHEIFGSHCGGA